MYLFPLCPAPARRVETNRCDTNRQEKGSASIDHEGPGRSASRRARPIWLSRA
jgi:hypothetical protein